MPRIRMPGAAGLVLGAALLLAGCSSSSSATPTPTPTPPPTAAASGVSGASGLGGLGGLTALHQNADLENRLPAQICGTNAFKMSMGGSGLGAADAGGLGDLGSILRGLSPTGTFSFAIAAPDPAASTDCGTSFFAIQLQGGDANQLLQQILAQETKDGGTTSQASLGGKNITQLVDSGGSKSYVYVNGDTVYGVQANDDTAASQALSQLP